MRHISFRISDDDYKKLVSNIPCKPTSYFKSIAAEVVNGNVKVDLSALNKTDTHTNKTAQTCLSESQIEVLRDSANKHGWSLSREIRFRLQTTIGNKIDFYDQELMEITKCRNEIKKIGLNINLILRVNRGILSDSDGFSEDVNQLMQRVKDLEGRLNGYIKLCNNRFVSNKIKP